MTRISTPALFKALLIGCLVAITTTAPVQADDMIKAGKKVFAKCRACHQVGPKARNLVGPELNGVVDRPAGSVEGFRYSPAMKAKVEAEAFIWTEENLDLFLTKPPEFLPKTRMRFDRGLPKQKDRDALIAYLKSFDLDGQPAE